MTDKIKYSWNITTLSPLHIGTGDRLREGFDFIEYQGGLWVANQGALMGAILDDAQKNTPQQDQRLIVQNLSEMTLSDLMEAGWLRPEHFDLENGLFRYHLSGTTSTKEKRGELLEQLKDVYGRPYLPGSGLKGVLRSALLRFRAGKDKRKPQINYPFNWQPGTRLNKKNARVAGQSMERRFFVPKNLKYGQQPPNFDLWKTFQVGDSSPIDPGALVLGLISVFPVRDKNLHQTKALPIDAEVVSPGAAFRTQILVDGWYFTDWRAADLAFSRDDQLYITSRFRDILQRESILHIDEENTFFSQFKDHLDEDVRETGQSIADWYLEVLVKEVKGLAENEFLMQLGAGTGWLNKTLGRVLQKKLSPKEFDTMVQGFGLGKGKWKEGGNVPLTRKICSLEGGRPVPLGWVKVAVDQAT